VSLSGRCGAGCDHGPVVELLNRPGAENQRPAVISVWRSPWG
jgi:hypothetical protein